MNMSTEIKKRVVKGAKEQGTMINQSLVRTMKVLFIVVKFAVMTLAIYYLLLSIMVGIMAFHTSLNHDALPILETYKLWLNLTAPVMIPIFLACILLFYGGRLVSGTRHLLKIWRD